MAKFLTILRNWLISYLAGKTPDKDSQAENDEPLKRTHRSLNKRDSRLEQAIELSGHRRQLWVCYNYKVLCK